MDKNKIYIISAAEMEKIQQKIFGAYLQIAESLEKDYLSVDLTREVKKFTKRKPLLTNGLDPLF